jgi:hypothetical protein
MIGSSTTQNRSKNMNTQEFNRIFNACKNQLLNSAEFNAINDEQEAADYIAKNLDVTLNNIIARQAELTAIAISDTEQGQAMRDYLLDLTYANLTK